MCKIICKYSKTGYLKYISHLDVLRFIQRSVRRAGIKAKYSEGEHRYLPSLLPFQETLFCQSPFSFLHCIM
jgi:uncharacterized protein (DUF2344 family)